MDNHSGFLPPEDKALTILRRKFLVGIPFFSVCGYMGARIVTDRFQCSKWVSRLGRIGGAVLTPIVGTMMIVHFNRGEIFRIGSGMMKELDEARKAEVGPFSDPQVREKWDSQVMRDGNRKFGRFFKTETFEEDEELKPKINYKSVVNEATATGSTSFRN